jgi:hypothetical protein
MTVAKGHAVPVGLLPHGAEFLQQDPEADVLQEAAADDDGDPPVTSVKTTPSPFMYRREFFNKKTI